MFWQISLTIIGAILSVILTRIFIRNRRLIQQNTKMIEQNTKMLEQMDKKIDLIAELIKSEGERTRELLMELRR